jgi:hypothetical protein
MDPYDRDIVYGLVANVANSVEVEVGEWKMSDLIADMQLSIVRPFEPSESINALFAELQAESVARAKEVAQRLDKLDAEEEMARKRAKEWAAQSPGNIIRGPWRLPDVR